MTNETKSTKVRDWSGVVVFAGLAANAVTAFAIQAWMTFGFGEQVWKLPDQLSVALVIALDLFAIMFMVLSYLLRGAGWPRFVSTVIFIFAISCQVFAAEMFGDHKGWPTEIRWFASLPAVFLALSQEGVILWRTRRVDRPEGKAVAVADRPAAPAKPKPQAAAPAKPTEQAPEPPKQERRRPGITARRELKGRPVDPEGQARREAFARRALAGEPTKTLAAEAGTSTKSIQNWAKALRESGPAISTETRVELPKQVEVLPTATPSNGAAILSNGGATQ